MGPQNLKASFSFCSAPWFLLLCLAFTSLPGRGGNETVQRQLKWITTEGKGDDSVSSDMKFRDIVRYDASESALQNTVIPKYK